MKHILCWLNMYNYVNLSCSCKLIIKIYKYFKHLQIKHQVITFDISKIKVFMFFFVQLGFKRKNYVLT